MSVVAELIQCRRELGLQAPLEADFIQGLDKVPYALVTLVDCQAAPPGPRGPDAGL